MRGFNDLSELAPEGVEHLLQLAKRLEEHPEPRALEGKVLALLFLSPSLRTQTSFQSAMLRLGGGSFVVSPTSGIHGLETRPGVIMDGVAGEHIREAIPVLASYGDALGIRAFATKESLDDDVEDLEFQAMAQLSSVPVINMESAIRHPCQSLADWKTMEDLALPREGGKFVLSWANHPKALPLAVPASTLQMAAMRGMDVTVLRPDAFALPDTIMTKARELAMASGGSIRETDDRREAAEDAIVIYAKSWSSPNHYGDDDAQREAKKRLHGWCVEEGWFDGAARDCRFMHCLPVRRGVVVSEDVLEGARSVVTRQARNRMWGQMAVLYEILKEAS
jgi:N-acetylornithine carbamoyltransferase